ncbi:MAG: signal peptide peptidase SppA [Kiloniellales bacterium]|nr:signal peptide peptidase SppA [Kiloniellales bacterium]
MRVILFLLKCLVGLFATIGFLITLPLILALFLGLGLPWQEEIAEVPAEAVLTIDLSGPVIENRPESLFSRSSLGDRIVLRDTVAALRKASRDERIKGLVVRFGPLQTGMANAQELREAIQDFRATGRFAFGFAESFGEFGNSTISYYIASAMDEIWLQPSGDLGAMGLRLEAPFLRGTLDKLGIEPRLAQREEYKGAMNTFTDSRLPEPQRHNLQQMVDSWMEQIVAAVAEERKLEADAVRGLIDRAPLSAEEGREAGLLDRLAYWDELQDELVGRTSEEMELFGLRAYAAATREDVQEGPQIAVIYGLGPISLTSSENDPVFGSVVFGSDTVAQAISEAIEDEDVEAILLRVDSPGGSYVASDTVHREVRRAREAGKPIIVSMGNLAASGGYFVAMAADKIVAHPGTVTGSIGVVAGKFVFSGLWEEIGLGWDQVQAGENAGIWSQNQDFTEAQWQRLQTSLDRIYEDFRAKVAAARGLSAEETRAAAKGQVWTGADAQRLGLVDELGGFYRAVALAKEAAGIAAEEKVNLRVLPPPRDSFFGDLVQDTLGDGLRSSGAATVLDWTARVVRLIDPLLRAAEDLGEDPRNRALSAPDLRLAD